MGLAKVQKNSVAGGLHSMTGYGAASCKADSKGAQYECVVRSLNAKQLDVQVRLPAHWEHREGAIRKQVETHLQRGRIQVAVSYVPQGVASKDVAIDEALFLQYYGRLHALAKQVGHPSTDALMATALRLPGVLQSKSSADQDEGLRAAGRSAKVWKAVSHCIQEAIAACVRMRTQEGAVLGTQMKGYLDKIADDLQKVAREEKRRDARVQKKLKAQWEDAFRNSESQERFHQELFFYLERMSFEEEKVRLGKHLAYFEETLGTAPGQGRKLGFIAQEINREINTLGSKAHDAVIQGIVVEMKNELEKIKEQLLNVL